MKISTHEIPSESDDGEHTLVAATETDVLGDATGIDTAGTDVVFVVLDNVGAADIETVTSYQSPLGPKFVAFAANHGPVPAGESISLTFDQLEGTRFRLTCTSSTGTDLEVEAFAFRYQG